MRNLTILIIGLSLAACQQATKIMPKADVHPFVGCWETENGLERESWTIDPSGWLVGYAASRDTAGNVTFFEHMRIERGGESEVLVVTGQNNTETRFKGRGTSNPNEYRFENPSHDFPQVIVYQRNGDALNAYIDLMAGGKRVRFDKSLCKVD